MELRSKYNKLRELLKGAGVYEDGMDVEEMRQIAQAMEISTSSYSGVECTNLERALLESEIDFQLMVNSTMIVRPATPAPSIDVFIGAGSFERDCDSPACNPIQLQVQALVHHELNWSPSRAEVRLLKREASELDSGLNLKRANLLADEESSSHRDATPTSLASADSGVSCEEIGTLSSISEVSTVPSIGEMPSRLLISTSSAAVSGLSDRELSSPTTISP